MYVIPKDHKMSLSFLSSTEDSDLGSLSDSIEPKGKPFLNERGFIPRAGGLVDNLVNSLSPAKSQSICTIGGKAVSPQVYKTGINDALTKIMLRRGSRLETESDLEPEPKAKLNSLVSIMVSTIMCLAANCPIPKSNIQATKLFLSTVVNDNGESPRNIKALLTLLKNYDGPYEGDTSRVAKYETAPSIAETVIIQPEVTLEPVAPPSAPPTDRVRTSRTRSRLPSFSPTKRSIESRKQIWN